MSKSVLTMLAAACVVGTFSFAAQAGDGAQGNAMVAAGKAAFEHRCAACHFLAPGKSGFGPNLRGVYGRKAGSLTGYAYSTAMASAGFVWDDSALRSWVADNEKFVPGTRMRHVSISDPTEQDFLIAYIKTLK